MDEKLKFYSDNENSLLKSVQSTIFKSYERTENLNKEKKLDEENLVNKIKNLEANISLRENEIKTIKENYEKQLTELKDELKLKSM